MVAGFLIGEIFMRRTVVLSLITVAAMSACGSGTELATSKVSTRALVSASPAAAEAAGTARFSGSMSMAAAGDSFSLPMSGELDFKAPALSMTIDMSEVPGGPDGVGAIEARLVDGVMYMKMGALLGGGNSGGASWVSIPFDDLEGSSGLGVTQNPADMMKGLRDAGEVKTLGRDAIDGVETTHYRAQVETAAALRNLSGDLKKSAKKVSGSMPATIPLDVWIDADGLPRRFVMAFEMRDVVSMSMKLNFTNYGEPVDVQAPPADQTMSTDDLGSLSAV